jgi:hypothetical protein
MKPINIVKKKGGDEQYRWDNLIEIYIFMYVTMKPLCAINLC